MMIIHKPHRSQSQRFQKQCRGNGGRVTIPCRDDFPLLYRKGRRAGRGSQSEEEWSHPWQLGLKTRLSGGGKKEQDEAFRKKGQNQSCRKASLQRLGKSEWVRGGGQLGGPSLARSGVAWS